MTTETLTAAELTAAIARAAMLQAADDEANAWWAAFSPNRKPIVVDHKARCIAEALRTRASA
jgi:hypothetical protein